jgi:hypothetical protein
MIDPSVWIDNELSNIIGTLAGANPEVASIALICFTAAAGISALL